MQAGGEIAAQAVRMEVWHPSCVLTAPCSMWITTDCSGCIRQHLDYKHMRENQASTCPACRAPADAAELKPCAALRDAALALRALKPTLLKMLLHTVQGVHGAHASQGGGGIHSQKPLDSPSGEAQGLPARPLSHTCVGGDPAVIITTAGCTPGGKRRRPGSREGGTHPAAVSSAQPSPLAGSRLRHGHPSSNTAVDRVSIEISSDSESEGATAKRLRRSTRGPQVRMASVHPDQPSCFLQGEDAVPSSSPPSDAAAQEVGVAAAFEAAVSNREAAADFAVAPLPRVGFTCCPVCGISVRAALVNSHLDSCIARQELNEPRQQQQQQGGGSREQQGRDATATDAALVLSDRPGRQVAPRPSHSAPTPLSEAPVAPAIQMPPKLAFNLISDKDLKKKMVALGLPVDGKKQVGGLRSLVWHRSSPTLFCTPFMALSNG